MQYLRINGRSLQSPVHPYTNAAGRRVTLVGCMHIGEPAYFTGLRCTIDGLHAAGAVVHCEGSALVPCDADMTDEEQQILADMRRHDEWEKRRVGELGWIGQVDGLGYPPQWHVNDLSYLQLIRRAGAGPVRQWMRRRSGTLDGPAEDPRRVARFRLGAVMTMRAMVKGPRVLERGTPPAVWEVLLGQRTALALDGVLGTDRDVVLVWGALHLLGLDTGLREHGFTPAGAPEWHTILTLPTVRSALWRWVTGGAARADAGQRT